MTTYTYTTLGDGTYGTSALGINDAGQIVGYYLLSSFGQNIGRGFLYSGGIYTTLDDPLATDGTAAQGINATGQIVGYYVDSSNNDHGFLYSNGTYTTLDDPLVITTSAGVYAILSLWLLPIIKGGLIGHQWALRMHGFETVGRKLIENPWR